MSQTVYQMTEKLLSLGEGRETLCRPHGRRGVGGPAGHWGLYTAAEMALCWPNTFALEFKGRSC